MPKLSAGLLPYRERPRLEILIAHPGGPFWERKDEGAWSIIKGVVSETEDPETAARREFSEETGWPVPIGGLMPLGEATQKSGKMVLAWAIEVGHQGGLDPERLLPGTFTMTWRGKEVVVPEIDRVAWCDPDTALRLLNPAQAVFVERLIRLIR